MIEITTHSGLGRFGAGGVLASDFDHQILSSTWASVVPDGRVPKDTTPTISTASLPVLARRFRADPHEIGRFEGLGLDSLELAEHVDQGQRRPRAGHSRRLWE